MNSFSNEKIAGDFIDSVLGKNISIANKDVDSLKSGLERILSNAEKTLVDKKGIFKNKKIPVSQTSEFKNHVKSLQGKLSNLEKIQHNEKVKTLKNRLITGGGAAAITAGTAYAIKKHNEKNKPVHHNYNENYVPGNYEHMANWNERP